MSDSFKLEDIKGARIFYTKGEARLHLAGGGKELKLETSFGALFKLTQACLETRTHLIDLMVKHGDQPVVQPGQHAAASGLRSTMPVYLDDGRVSLELTTEDGRTTVLGLSLQQVQSLRSQLSEIEATLAARSRPPS